jgi:hypothetical protein
MINVCCIKVGTKYDARYVNILFDMVRRNLPSGFPGRFICFTDDAAGLDQAIQSRKVPSDLTGWWAKLWLFSQDAFPDGGRVLYFDLDTVITGPLDDIVIYDGPFAILRDAYRVWGLQSSVMAWEAGNKYARAIWEQWISAGKPTFPGGDQQWIEECLGNAGWRVDLFQVRYPGKFRSYKVECRNIVPRGTSVVFFHGDPRPHEISVGWVPEAWRVNGGLTNEWIVQANVSEETLRANVEYATSLDCQWIKNGSITELPILIVAGGPSLKDQLWRIRGMAMSSYPIMAVNNAYKYLRDNGIQAGAQVMCDARKENLEFVAEPGVLKYYASQCAQEVLRVAGTDLICWHPAFTTYHDMIQDRKGSDVQVGAGSTAGLKAIAIAYILGYRNIMLFGFDSCYADTHHAYAQALNDSERILDAVFNGKHYKCAPWMVTQAEEFKELAIALANMGCTVQGYGDGLIKDVLENLELSPVDDRNIQLQFWLRTYKKPVGAEIGVFRGELSKRLLLRPDLTLYMVDHWASSDAASSYAQSGDFHARLSDGEQRAYYEAAKLNTHYARERARIIRKPSVDAAMEIPDGSLDFVFIDADHSYEGCRADIEAWLPKIKNGGFISGHDYDHPEFPHWGVKRAVDERFGSPEKGDNFMWRVQV